MKKILSLLAVSLAACGWGAVAKIGDTEYNSLTAACAAAKDGETVTLLQNVSESPTVTAACTVDLGGFTVTGCIYGQYNTRGGVCTIKNGTATSGFDGAPGTDKTYPKGAMVFENVNMNITCWTDGHPVIVKGGTFLADVRVGSQPVVVESGNFKTKFVRDGAGYPILKGGRYAQAVTNVAKIAYGYQFVRDDADATYPYAVTPVTATRALWTGAAGDGDLANASNWSCVDASGAAVASTTPVATGSILCLNGDTAFNCPAGTTPLWKSVAFQPLTGAPQDVYGYFQRTYETHYWNPNNSLKEESLGMIDSDFVFFPEAYLTYGGTTTPSSDLGSSSWKSAHLNNATTCFSGWVYVPDAQAGFWTVTLGFDDYCGFTLDGELVYSYLTFVNSGTSATYTVTPGWHTYTFVCGDTWGGEGGSMPNVSINGASAVAFTAANFTFGAAANTVKLTADCDWRGLGTLTFPAGLTLDLNGHNLAIAGAKGSFKSGATISGVGVVTVDGGSFDANGIAVPNASLVFTNSVVAKATWTGAGAADNVNDPANWSCEDADGHTVAGGVPGETTVVKVDTAAMTLQVPAGQTLASAYLRPTTEAFTLAANCDWRGAFTATRLPSSFDGTILPYLDAPKGSFINTGFKPNGDTRVVMDVTVQGTGEYWFGAWNKNDHRDLNFSLCNDGSAVYVAYQYQNFGWGSPLGTGRHIVELDRNYYLRDDTVLQCHRLHASFQINYPLYLFAQNRAGTAGTQGSQGTIRFHECWIYDNGTLVRHFVPVRKTDGTVGAYDLVNGAFYANGGTGAFTGGVGADVRTQAAYLPQRTIDLAGHTLALAPIATASAVTVTDSSEGTAGELHLHVTPELTFTTTAFTFSGNTKVVFETGGASLAVGTKLCSLTAKPEGVTLALDAAAAATGVNLVATSDGVFYGADPNSQEAVWAHWTGAAGDSDPASGANWAATNLAGRAVANAVLTRETHVYLHGAATIKVPADGFTLKTLDLGATGVLTLDASAWTGATGQAILTTVNGVTPAADLATRVRIVNPRLDVQLSADGTQILAIAKATMAWRHLKVGSDYSINASCTFKDRPLTGYTTYTSPTNTFQPAVIGNGTGWQTTYISKGCCRYDGWFCVTDEQAGTWNVTQSYDDYMAWAVDGDWKITNPTYTTYAYATFDITAGWHHFTLVCGDTAGGYGYYQSNASSLAIQINGAETLVPFDERTFTFDDPTACASGDLALTAAGETPAVTCEVAADCRLVLDPAVTHLTLMRAPVFTAGAKIALAAKYAEATAGTFTLMTWEKGTVETQGVALNDLFDATSAKGANPAVTVVTNDDGSGALRLTLDTASDAVTAHWVGGVDNDITKPGNWLCTNAAGETVTTVPGWGTDVFIDAETCNMNVPAGTTLAYATLTLGDTITLAADCDWSGLDGHLTWLAGKTIDVNGHALTLPATYDLKSGTVTSGVAGGSCRIVVPEGAYVINTGLALTGSLAFIKDGAGTYRAEKKDQTYTEGTVVAGGIATSPASGNGSYSWSPWQTYIYGVRKSSITVEPGGIFDTAGNHDYRGFHFILAGGTLRNSGADMSDNHTGIGSITLTADSIFDMRMTTVQNGASGDPMNENGAPVMQLNGHTLDIRLAANKYWKPNTLIVRNGLVRVRGTDGNVVGANLWNYGDITAETADFDIGCRLEFKNNATVRDFTTRYEGNWGWSETGKVVTVCGTFHPVSDYFCNVKLIDGASLDLSTKEGVWSTLSADHGNSKNFYATFADDATIKIETGARTFASGEQIISWTTAPTGVRFRPVDLHSSYSFAVRADGVYVYSGCIIFVR